MTRYFLGVDFSDRSLRAEAQALLLAAKAGAELQAVHIIDADAPPRLAAAARDEARERAAALSARGKAAGVSCGLITVQGEAHVELPRFAREVGASCVVLGAHRRSPERNAFIGTTADRILRASASPVLVVRRAAAQDYRTAIAAIDLQAPDLRPLRTAIDLRLTAPAQVTALFGAETDAMRRLKLEAESLAAVEHAFAEEAPALERQAADLLAAAGFGAVKAMVRPVSLNAADLVLRAAREAGADLIILGAKAKGADHRQPLGSVSETVLRRAEIDVLVVPGL